MHAQPSRGMTLIEMLVVLLIMGLLVSVTVLSTGLINRGDSSEAGKALVLAEDLSRLFTHAGQLALANNEVLGWSLHNNQEMRWWRWSSGPSNAAAITNSTRVPSWLQAEDLLRNTVQLPDGLALELMTQSPGRAAVRNNLSVTNFSGSNTTAAQDGTPAVVFFPGREMSAFDIYITAAEGGQALARVWPDTQGKINWGGL